VRDALLYALLFALVVDLYNDWSTSLSERLAKRAARRLPSPYVERFEEEWLDVLSKRPRLLRLFFALDLYRAAFVITAQSEQCNLVKFALRRTRDVIISLVLLFVFAPTMLLFAVYIKCVSRGPLLVAHFGIKSNGRRRVYLYSFRTEGLPRFTAALIERAGVQSLPLLFSILRGDLPIRVGWAIARVFVTSPPENSNKG
jgi:hypothetical protein